MDKHAPVKKHTIKNARAPWIDDELLALWLIEMWQRVLRAEQGIRMIGKPIVN